MLESGKREHISETKEWYDGYHFGDGDVFCPWDVISHVDLSCEKFAAKLQAYWINTSGNDMVKRFVDTEARSAKSAAR